MYYIYQFRYNILVLAYICQFKLFVRVIMSQISQIYTIIVTIAIINKLLNGTTSHTSTQHLSEIEANKIKQ
jgi:hypothetical protein